MSEGIFTEADVAHYPRTPEQKSSECLSIGLRVMDAVELLKMSKHPTAAQIPIVRFCADKCYDVHLLVRVTPKKSQRQIAEEMINGK